MKRAKLEFQTHEQAEAFVSAWSRETGRGHIVANQFVILHKVTPEEEDFIDTYTEVCNTLGKEENKLRLTDDC